MALMLYGYRWSSQSIGGSVENGFLLFPIKVSVLLLFTTTFYTSILLQALEGLKVFQSLSQFSRSLTLLPGFNKTKMYVVLVTEIYTTKLNYRVEYYRVGIKSWKFKTSNRTMSLDHLMLNYRVSTCSKTKLRTSKPV